MSISSCSNAGVANLLREITSTEQITRWREDDTVSQISPACLE